MEKITNYDQPKSLWRWIVVAAAICFYANWGNFISGIQAGLNDARKDTTETKIDLSRFTTFTQFTRLVFSTVSSHILSK